MSFTDPFSQVDFKNETQVRLVLSSKDAEVSYLRRKHHELLEQVQHLEGKTELSPWQEKTLVDGLRGIMKMLEEGRPSEEILKSAEAGGVSIFLLELAMLDANREEAKKKEGE